MAQVLHHNVSVHEFVCEGLPSWGLGMGVAMGIAGSIGINIGQNVQAMGIKSLGPTEYTSPWRSRQWRIGLFIFIAFALINFGALAFAPASILVPIESLQFVTNVAWNSVVNKIRVGLRMQLGVLLALVGTSLSVVFGAPSICHSPAQMKEYWASTAWWLFLAITLSCATCCFMMHRFYRRRWKQTGELPPHPALLVAMMLGLDAALHAIVLAVLFTAKGIFKAPDNDFPIDGALITLFGVDYALVTFAIGALALVIAAVVRSKKYFRYKYEGERGIRAMREMVFYVYCVMTPIPFYRVAHG